MAYNIKTFFEMILCNHKIKLMDRAYKKEMINDVIEQFGTLNYSKLKQQTGKYIYFNMLYNLYKDYGSMKKIDEGIEKLYNSPCVKYEDKYANALFCIAKVIHNNTSLDNVQINGILEVIASLGNVCITGQRRGIIQLIFQFKDYIEHFLKDRIKIPQETKPIRRAMDEIFFNARIKVANKLMDDFYIKKHNRNFTDPHMEDFFKKCLNKIYNFNIPIMSEQDPLGFNIESNLVLEFLANINMESLILENVLSDIKSKCNDDMSFYNMIVDWSFSYFHLNKIQKDMSTFLSSCVFDGETTNLRTDMIYTILENEGYIKSRDRILNDIIKADDLEEQVKIIEGDADILSVKNQANIVLQEYLILKNDLTAIKLLYNANCIKLDLKDISGNTLLVNAVKFGFFDMAKFLIKAKANIEDRDKYGNTLLMLACKNCDLKMSSLLLENKIDLEKRDMLNETVLIHACKLECFEIVELLLKHNANVNVTSKEGYTVLMFNYKNILIPKLLIQNGANVNKKVGYGLTPLMYACEVENFCMVKLLVENNANINEVGRCNQTALMYACEFKARDIVEYLIKNGADIEKKANGGATALIFAFFTCVKDEQKNFDIVKLLLQYGADVNARGEYGSAIIYACKYWSYKVFKLLIEYGANLNEKDYNGKTLLKLAYERGDRDILNIVKKYESKINVISEVPFANRLTNSLGT